MGGQDFGFEELHVVNLDVVTLDTPSDNSIAIRIVDTVPEVAYKGRD
jgi:hypothetical protein